jgi:hypothetical protein
MAGTFGTPLLGHSAETATTNNNIYFASPLTHQTKIFKNFGADSLLKTKSPIFGPY